MSAFLNMVRKVDIPVTGLVQTDKDKVENKWMISFLRSQNNGNVMVLVILLNRMSKQWSTCYSYFNSATQSNTHQFHNTKLKKLPKKTNILQTNTQLTIKSGITQKLTPALHVNKYSRLLIPQKKWELSVRRLFMEVSFRFVVYLRIR